MKERKNDVWRLCLMLVLLCIWSLPHLAGAGYAPPIPTGPLVNGLPAVPDYYTTANWANSPRLAKFVDTLPRLGSGNANNLGQYLYVGRPDVTSYPGSDYYEIDLVEYREQMHSDLPATGTLLRGYVQVNKGTDISVGELPSSNKCGADQHLCTALDTTVNPDSVHYLGPIIISERDRPVRIKFTNRLPVGSAGDLFIPTDTTVMGAGPGPAYQGAARGLGAPCDNTVDGNKCASYPQNRAAIHLHGGRTPWISDGTPHQWITPAGENTPFTKGVSLQNVPDMPDPGDGSTTYYYTNQQSARLMFYHDHAFGITRLNVYVGEAAGYVIQDKYEQDLIARGIIPADQIPLIIQDKTYVNASEIRKYDPLWNWGSGTMVNGVRTVEEGDLWLPHVYLPAQTSTAGKGGVNPFGRWMYGPWFYPATIIEKGPVANPYYDADCSSPFKAVYANCTTPGQPLQIPGTPNTSMGMEAFQDSAVVNGTVFPSLTVDPRAYRFRVLNAANDRFFNLSFYEADDGLNMTLPDGTKGPSPAGIDAQLLSPDLRLLAGDRSNQTEVRMLSASANLATLGNWPALWPIDGREGGVPDPAFRGPKFLQIGTESGFLPKPVLIEHQPITYITDPTAFWVGNVDKMGLALGPAERADVIVDFSAFAGKTLILYNDAPAAWPAGVGGYDYYTGAPDNRDTGGFGAGGTFNAITGVFDGGHGPEVGYAPNTRTVMQIIVRPTAGADPAYDFSQANLENEFTAAAPVTAVNPAPAKTLFERAQEPIIVGQAAYAAAYPNSYFPPNFPWEGIAQINDQSLQFVTLAGAPVVVATEPKALHDEMGASFDPIYGRMSGNLGMQIPNPTTLTATMVNYGFTDIPSEYVNNSTSTNITVVPDPVTGFNKRTDGTEIWKISHNGVDTHPIHFHIFDVQVINRVGWDGQILMPEPNELGWKEVVKISPLEDTIVAVRPRAPDLPFGITNSLRPLNPAIPIGSTMGFTSIDPVTGQAYVAPSPFAAGVTNILFDFGWEYVWHCHILSHEEMDMMRPIVLTVINNKPDAPVQTTSTAFTGNVTVTWNDPTPLSAPTTLGNIKNEIGFRIERCAGRTCTNFRQIGTALANATDFTDTAAIVATDPYLRYRIFAYNAAGVSPASNIVTTMNGAPINGVCGASNGTTFIVRPTIGLCTVGNVTPVTGSGPWSWSCTGFNAGTAASCTAPIQQYTLLFVAAAHGTLSGSAAQTVNYNANATAVTAVPNTAYQFVSWTNSLGTTVSLLPTLTATAVRANTTYTANFSMAKDFNADGSADILWTNSTNNSSLVWYMNNTTKLTEAALPAPPAGNGWAIVGTGDFNHDGKTDLLWRNSTTGANRIYYMNGVTKLSEVTIASQATPWVVAGVADFDKDGNVDILWRHPTSTTNNLFIWYMNGAVKNAGASAYITLNRTAMGQPWLVAGVGDFNGDGNPDILWRHPSATTNNTYVWYMNNATVASASGYMTAMVQPWVVAGVTDFNSDGAPDILWRNPQTNTNNTQVWYMNGIVHSGAAITITPNLASNWQIVGK